MTRPAFLVAFSTAVAVTFAAGAEAQVYDHLTCFKIKDAVKLEATVDLDALQADLDGTGCTIKGGGKFFCTVVDKGVTSYTDKSNPPQSGVALTGTTPADNRICYKLKCPKVELPPLTVTDQFGVRAVDKMKAGMLCTPALIGTPPTTSTTTTSTTTTSTIASPGTTVVPVCGNGVAEGTEPCDGMDFADRNCVTELGTSFADPCNGPDPQSPCVGAQGLTCTSECTVQTTNCLPRCGNSVVDSPEQCDGSVTGIVTCEFMKGETGWGGTVTCNGPNSSGDPNVAPACRYNDSGCSPICGDGLIRGNEECDVGVGSGLVVSPDCPPSEQYCGQSQLPAVEGRCTCQSAP